MCVYIYILLLAVYIIVVKIFEQRAKNNKPHYNLTVGFNLKSSLKSVLNFSFNKNVVN
jgi:hypothetical protein